MREPEDAVRSVAKYVAQVLGDEWDIRLRVDRGQIKPPFGRVQMVGAPAIPAGPAWRYEVTQPMAVELYPVPANDPEESELVALRVIARLNAGFQQPGVGLGRSRLVPLWNFEGVPLDEDSNERLPNDFLRVADYAPQALADPEDERRFRVLCDLRLRWDATPWWKRADTGELIQQGQVVEQVKVRINGS